MADQFAHGRNIRRLLRVVVEGKSFRHLPYKDLAIVGSRCYDAIVERVPVDRSA